MVCDCIEVTLEKHERDNSSESYGLSCDGSHYLKLDRTGNEPSYGETSGETIVQRDDKVVNSCVSGIAPGLMHVRGLDIWALDGGLENSLCRHAMQFTILLSTFEKIH